MKIFAISLIFFAIFLSVQAEPPLILTEHVDYVYLRLHHLLSQTPSEIVALRKQLSYELNKSSEYNEAWTESKKIYKGRKDKLKMYSNISIPDEYHIALIAYTLHDVPKDKPFYSAFNTATRTLCSGLSVDSFPYKSFFQLLRMAIRSLNIYPQFTPDGDAYYRGVSVRHFFHKEQQLAFQQFTSLSTNRTVSEIYSANVTLFEFKKVTHTGIKMTEHSKFPGESEILVSPLQVYEIKEEILGNNGQNYDFFKLEPIDEESEFVYFKSKGGIRVF